MKQNISNYCPDSEKFTSKSGKEYSNIVLSENFHIVLLDILSKNGEGNITLKEAYESLLANFSLSNKAISFRREHE